MPVLDQFPAVFPAVFGDDQGSGDEGVPAVSRVTVGNSPSLASVGVGGPVSRVTVGEVV